MTKRVFPGFFCIAFAACSLFTQAGEAASVVKSAKDSAVIDLEDMVVSLGDELYAVDTNGKKKALLQVKKTKGNQALVAIVKGSVQIGYEIIAKDQGASAISDSRGSLVTSVIPIGVYIMMTSDSMTIKNAAGTTDVTGSNMSFGIIGDYKLNSTLHLGPLLGSRSWKNYGKQGTQKAEVEISYIEIASWLKYFPSRSTPWLWMGGGGGVLMPTSRSANIIDSESIGATGEVLLGAGGDFKLSKKFYLLSGVQFAKLLFASSSDVNGQGLGLYVAGAMAF